MNVNLDKKLKKAISVLECIGPSKVSSPKRNNKDGFNEALNCIKRVLAEDGYWSKAYANRAVNCLFNCLDLDDSSLRLLADQSLNAIFRKFILKSQTSRVLAALLNELSRNGSARGFAASISMLPVALKQARENRLGVYAMHFLHAIREALKRPEQSIQSSIEAFSTEIIRFFKSDYTEAHVPYFNRLMVQCLDNFSLNGAPNRTSSTVLSALAENAPGMMALICGRLLGLLSIVEEKKHKNEIVGVLGTLRKIWPSLIFDQQPYTVRLIIVKILACLKSSSNEIEIPTLELLQCIISETPVKLLKFQPLLFTIEQNEQNEDDDKRSNSRLYEMDPLADLNESTISRCNSVTSLSDSEFNSPRSNTTNDTGDEMDNLSNRSDCSTPTPQNHQSYVEMDPLFQSDSPAVDYLLDKQFEAELNINEETKKEVEGFLCVDCPRTCCPPNSDFYFYSSTLIAEKFLLPGRLNEIRQDSEVRTSIKIQALKYLAVVGSVYEDLINVTVIGKYRQSISDLHQLLSSDDEGLCMTAYSLFANIESCHHQNGRKLPTNFYTAGRFLSITSSLLQNANPRRLKELLQILTNNIEIVLADDHLFTSVCDSALSSIDCDYFLLKIARADFFAKIRWNRLSLQLIYKYQSLCLKSFCKQCFDGDFRVVKATMDNLHRLVLNTEFGFITNLFHITWNDSLFLPSFTPFSQVFALHQNYSFRGDSPDLSLEENLSEVLETLTREYALKPAERTAGYINGFLVLARSYLPTIYASSWGCLNRLNQGQSAPLLGMLVEIANSSTTTLSQLVHVFKLIGLIFSGIAENVFIRGANRAEFNQNVVFFEGQQMLDKILIIYLRLLNLYYTIIKEGTTQTAATSSIASSLTSPLFPKINWSGTSEHETSRSYNVSNLAGTGIKPYHSTTSFLNSPSLCLLEPAIRGSFANFMSSMKSDVEDRVVAPLESALEGLRCILEMLPQKLLAPFMDELLLYVRASTNLAVKPITNLLTQMLKVLFGHNAANISSNMIVSLKVRHCVPPTDYLEMLVGRAINNYSVHVAFLDRFEQMELHKLRHIGWNNRAGITADLNKHTQELITNLEQFEKSVTYLLHSYLNISDSEARCSILKLACVLVSNDIRYDKLDPNNRVLNSVLANIRHERLKNGQSIDTLFIFLCIVARSVESLRFDEIVELVCGCVQRVDLNIEEDVNCVLNAVHVVLIEAISFYSLIPKKLVELLNFEEKSLFQHSPSKVAELWTAVLHWARSTKSGLLWQDLSSDFIGSVFSFVGFVENVKSVKNVGRFRSVDGTYKIKWELAHALSVALKTCDSSVFRPINQLFSTFLTTSKEDIFLCIPFILALLCRLDQESVLIQLVDVDSNALETVGISLARLFLRETLTLFRLDDRSQLEFLEDGIAFFGIMLLNILRSETLRSTKFSNIICDSFQSTIIESSEFEQFKVNINSFVHSYPKVYSVWILIIFQLDMFEDVNRTVFTSILPFRAKQLVSLLFLQRLCDKRLQLKDSFLNLLNVAPDDFLVRILKVARPKQLELIKARLSSERIEVVVDRVFNYLSIHPMIGIIESVVEIADQNMKFKLSLKYDIVQSFTSNDAKDTEQGYKHELKNYNEMCLYLMESMTNSDDISCLAKLTINLEQNSLIKLIETMKSTKRGMFIKAIFEVLNDQIRDINNNAYLLGQQPNFTPVLTTCQSIADLLDNPALNSSDCRQILIGFHQLPQEIEFFENIEVKCMDRILNVAFIKDLMEAETMSDIELDSDFYIALTELFYRGNLHKAYSNDYSTIDNLCLVLRLILDNVEKIGLIHFLLLTKYNNLTRCQRLSASKSIVIIGEWN